MLAGLVEVDESVHTSWNIDGVMVVGLFERHGDMLGHIMSRALASDDTTRHNTNMMTHTHTTRYFKYLTSCKSCR
jgi:hypothetical protein